GRGRAGRRPPAVGPRWWRQSFLLIIEHWTAEVRDDGEQMPGARAVRPARPGLPGRSVRGAGELAAGRGAAVLRPVDRLLRAHPARRHRAGVPRPGHVL